MPTHVLRELFCVLMIAVSGLVAATLVIDATAAPHARPFAKAAETRTAAGDAFVLSRLASVAAP